MTFATKENAMIFLNNSPSPVILRMDGRSYDIAVGQTLEFPCDGIADFTLSHTHPSEAMSEQAIAGELSSPSVLAEALSAMQKPYFRLALDTRYRFEVTPDTVFTIERHRAYPQPGLVYSRLFPKAQGATLHFMEHGFAEKEEYTKTFKSASRSASIGERVSRILLLIFASVFTLLLVLAAIWTGLVGFCLVLVFAVLICGGCGLIFAMCTATRKLRDRLFLADFESETIAANFRKAMQKNAIDIN